MWIKPYNRNAFPFEKDNSRFGSPANIVSLLHLQEECNFRRTIIKFPPQILPGGRAYGLAAADADLNHLRECTVSFTAGFSEPLNGLMFTPQDAFVIETDSNLEIISESCWHTRLFYNRHIRCDRSTRWQWRFDGGWAISREILEEVFIVGQQYPRNYFHWFIDCLPKIWLLKNYVKSDVRIALGAVMTPFQRESLAIFDVNSESCIELEPHRVIRFKRAIVPAFEFTEPLKAKRPNYDTGIWHSGWWPDYFNELRERTITYFRCPRGRQLKLFVSRADAQHRKLINEDALRDFLQREGFTVVIPGELPFADQVKLFAQAGVIVGIHGAGLTNLLWAPPGCTVIELAPAGLRDVGYRFSSHLCGHLFSTVLCRALEHPRGLAYSDIEVDVDAVRAALAG